MSDLTWAAVSVKRHANNAAYVIHAHFQDGETGTTQHTYVDDATPVPVEEMFVSGVRKILDMNPDYNRAINLIGPDAEAFIKAYGIDVPDSRAHLRLIAKAFYKKYIRPAMLAASNDRVHAFDPTLKKFNPKTHVLSETGPESVVQENIVEGVVEENARFAVISAKSYPSKNSLVFHVHVQNGTEGETRQFLVAGKKTQGNPVPHLHTAMDQLKKMTLDLEDRFVYIAGFGSKSFLAEVAESPLYTGVVFRHLNSKRYLGFVKPYLAEDWQEAALEVETSAFELPSGTDRNQVQPENLHGRAAYVPPQSQPTDKNTIHPAIVRSRPHQGGSWAAISVKWHLLRNCDVIHIHAQDGDVQKQKRILVENKTDSTDLYLQGLTALFTMDPAMTFRSIHLAGPGADKALDKLGTNLDGTNITFHKLSVRFHDTVIANTMTFATRRYAFDPTVPTYCDPVRIPQNTTTVHIYSDGSQILGKARTPGYGHGYTTNNTTTGTVEANSTWNTTPSYYEPNQFELHGVLTALDAATARHAPSPGTIDQLRLVVHCDNVHAVESVHQAAKDATVMPLEAVIGKEARNFDNHWVNRRGITVEAHWVKGHNGEKFNEATDQLAVAARLLHYGHSDYDNYTVNIHNIASTIDGVVDRTEDPDDYPEPVVAPDLTDVFARIRNAA